jgi:hypothetical protein
MKLRNYSKLKKVAEEEKKDLILFDSRKKKFNRYPVFEDK